MLLPVALEAKSEPVGVQGNRLYDGASSGTTQASWCSSVSAADALWFRTPAILFAILQPVKMSMLARESFVR
ncbi:hypothetical protein [Microcoleus sp. AT9b-C3]|uniref:hypothetical protein n=1 Tax=Microcoleus sp. AT9b-C3 TaxID=2818629 RepID=UPI002FD60E11